MHSLPSQKNFTFPLKLISINYRRIIHNNKWSTHSTKSTYIEILPSCYPLLQIANTDDDFNSKARYYQEFLFPMKIINFQRLHSRPLMSHFHYFWCFHLIKYINKIFEWNHTEKYVIYALICRQKVLIFPEVREIACVIFTPIPVLCSRLYLKKPEKQSELCGIYINLMVGWTQKNITAQLYIPIFFSAPFSFIWNVCEQSQKSVFYFLILQTEDDKKIK